MPESRRVSENRGSDWFQLAKFTHAEVKDHRSVLDSLLFVVKVFCSDSVEVGLVVANRRDRVLGSSAVLHRLEILNELFESVQFQWIGNVDWVVDKHCDRVKFLPDCLLYDSVRLSNRSLQWQDLCSVENSTYSESSVDSETPVNETSGEKKQERPTTADDLRVDFQNSVKRFLELESVGCS